MLITKSEILTIVEGRELQSAQITDSDILIAEKRHVRDTVLGNALYSLIVANAGNVYDSLIDDYIKPALAWLVFASVLDRVQVEVSDTGINMLVSNNSQSIQREQLSKFKQSVMDNGNFLLEELRKFCVDRYNAKDSLYSTLDYVNTAEVDSTVYVISNPKKNNSL